MAATRYHSEVTVMVEMDIAVTLSPAVNRFANLRRIYDTDGDPVPEAIEDGWEQLMRIRDWAESYLGQM
jgi:hypothetical protein